MPSKIKNYIISDSVDIESRETINFIINNSVLSKIDKYLTNNFKEQQLIGYVRNNTGQIVANVLRLTLFAEQNEPERYKIFAIYTDGNIDQDYTGTIHPL